jgi:hypothetical protein
MASPSDGLTRSVVVSSAPSTHPVVDRNPLVSLDLLDFCALRDNCLMGDICQLDGCLSGVVNGSRVNHPTLITKLREMVQLRKCQSGRE